MIAINRNRIVIIIIGLAIVIGSILGIIELAKYLSLRDVTFILSDRTQSAIIYQDYDSHTLMPTKVAEVSNGDIVKIADGDYDAIPLGADIDTTPVRFTVSSDTRTVMIDPDFSETYLADRLIRESPTLQAILRDKYSPVIDGYTINEGQLLGDGSWYVTSILGKPPEGQWGLENVNRFRVILHQQDSHWQVVAEPSLVLNYKDYSDIPKNIIKTANSLE